MTESVAIASLQDELSNQPVERSYRPRANFSSFSGPRGMPGDLGIPGSRDLPGKQVSVWCFILG